MYIAIFITHFSYLLQVAYFLRSHSFGFFNGRRIGYFWKRFSCFLGIQMQVVLQLFLPVFLFIPYGYYGSPGMMYKQSLAVNWPFNFGIWDQIHQFTPHHQLESFQCWELWRHHQSFRPLICDPGVC